MPAREPPPPYTCSWSGRLLAECIRDERTAIRQASIPGRDSVAGGRRALKSGLASLTRASADQAAIRARSGGLNGRETNGSCCSGIPCGVRRPDASSRNGHSERNSSLPWGEYRLFRVWSRLEHSGQVCCIGFPRASQAGNSPADKAKRRGQQGPPSRSPSVCYRRSVLPDLAA